MNTKDYGIPQNRERVYIIGSKKSTFIWPKPTISNKLKNYIDHNDKNKFYSDKILGYSYCEGSIFIQLTRKNRYYCNTVHVY